MTALQKMIVLAENDDAGWYAVGPVYTDESEAKLRDEIENGRGDTVRGTIRLLSASEFRAEAGDAR